MDSITLRPKTCLGSEDNKQQKYKKEDMSFSFEEEMNGFCTNTKVEKNANRGREKMSKKTFPVVIMCRCNYLAKLGTYICYRL